MVVDSQQATILTMHLGVRVLLVASLCSSLASPSVGAFQDHQEQPAEIAANAGESTAIQELDQEKLAALKSETEKLFREQVTPFIKRYCIECHSNKRPTEAGVNFSPALKNPSHAAFSEQWKKAAARIEAHDMPPDYAETPSDEEREMFGRWLETIKYLSPPDPGPFVIRRLTKTEYANTLRDLLGVSSSIASSLPEEVAGEGYLNSLSALQLEQYLLIANKAIEQISAPGTVHTGEVQRLFFEHSHSPEPLAQSNVGATSGNATAEEIEFKVRLEAQKAARQLARLAYRRPPTDGETEVLLQVFDLARQKGMDYTQSLCLVLKAVLVSPQFLFITPASDQSSDTGIVAMDSYQLASRMSYFLWATMPDRELMTLADSGKLAEPSVLKAQVRGMLMDPRSRALFDGFGDQWLGIAGLLEQPFDREQFPQMTEDLRSAMIDEPRLVFEKVLQENRSAFELLDNNYTFLNQDLASIYGLEQSIVGQEMRLVTLDDANRGGILGMPSVLAATSFPNRTSPVKRGVWVLEQVLGEHVPSAPPDVPALESQQQETMEGLTLRQRTELHRTDPVCANCHKILDPIGFGLENFDAIGRWRELDENGERIDASGVLPSGQEFANPRQLKAIISLRQEEFARNLVERLLAYALCRRLEGYDEIVVDGLMRDIADDGYRMQSIVEAVVTSYPFINRRIVEE